MEGIGSSTLRADPTKGSSVKQMRTHGELTSRSWPCSHIEGTSHNERSACATWNVRKVSYLLYLVGNVRKRSHVADAWDWQQRASLAAFLFHRKFLKTSSNFLLRISELEFKVFDTSWESPEKNKFAEFFWVSFEPRIRFFLCCVSFYVDSLLLLESFCGLSCRITGRCRCWRGYLQRRNISKFRAEFRFSVNCFPFCEMMFDVSWIKLGLAFTSKPPLKFSLEIDWK